MRAPLLLLVACILGGSASAQAPEFSVRVQDRVSQGTAALWTDIDADGAADLVFANGQRAHSLFRQFAPGIFFRDDLFLASPQLTDGVFVDLDGDGDRDFLHGSLSSSVYLENDGTSLVPTLLPGFTGLNDVRTVDAVDVDGDGRLDVFAGRREGLPNVLLLQTAAGWQSATGDLVTDDLTTNAACWGDIDDDGDLDVYLANSGGTTDRLYRNEGQGMFSARILTPNPDDASTSCVWGDADGDLDLDLFVAVANGERSRLFLNDGSGALTLASTEVFPDLRADLFNASWGDLDNDGDLDLVVVGRDEPIRAFIAGGGVFTEATLVSPNVFATAAALYDLDGDGDLDIALSAGDSARDEPSALVRNDLPEGDLWLDIALRGTVSNREGIGATVIAYLSDTERSWAVRQTMLAHTSRRTQSNTELHFGIGKASLDSVAVVWPTAVRDVYSGVAVGERIVLTESAAVSASPDPESLGLSLDVWPNPTRGPLNVTLRSGSDGVAMVEVFDVRGRRVWQQVRGLRAGVHEDIEIDLDPQASGIYVVRARQDDAAVSTRVTLSSR